MAKCSRCGNPIEFRYVDGRCVPLHLYGSCIGGAGTRATNYSGYRISRESTCFSTNCPECGDEVFFIRHNGGSVWIDPPLGPPWYKHACLDSSSTPGTRKSLSAEYKLRVPDLMTEPETTLVIGVVKSTRVDISKKFTDIDLETGKRETRSIRAKYSTGFLVGKLCIYDSKKEEIWAIEEPTYVFAVYNRQHPIAELVNYPKLVNCPKCGVKLNPRNLSRHLRRTHGARG